MIFYVLELPNFHFLMAATHSNMEVG